MYRVIKYFTDLQDNNHAYNVGDVFPRHGMNVSENRIEELSTNKNRQHTPLIEYVETEKKSAKKKGRSENADADDGDLQ